MVAATGTSGNGDRYSRKNAGHGAGGNALTPAGSQPSRPTGRALRAPAAGTEVAIISVPAREQQRVRRTQQRLEEPAADRHAATARTAGPRRYQSVGTSKQVSTRNLLYSTACHGVKGVQLRDMMCGQPSRYNPAAVTSRVGVAGMID